MLYDPSTANHLKPWLIRTLEPICDAEPGALADYILALLKHNVSENEMRKELAVQLDEFLEKECPAFLETLFTVLRTKSYLPYAASPPPSFNSKPLDPGIPIPLDGLITPSSPDRGVKRGLEGDEREGRAPAKGPRLNSDGHFSRYPSHGRSSGGWNQRNGPNDYQDGGDSMNVFGGMGVIPVGVPNQQRGGSYQPPDQKRGICRDYHNHGYCARGAHCKYSHGDDAVIPPMYIGGSPLAPGLPFYPMFPGLVPFAGAAYDPHEARMDMRPLGGRNHARAPVIPRSQQEGQGMQMSGELPVIQDLTPVVPPEAGLDSDVPSTSVEHDQGFEPEDHSVAEAPVNSPNGSNGVDMDVSQQAPFTAVGLHNFRGGGRGGRGRGTFGGEAHRFRPEKRNDKTLVVEKIPEDKLSMERVREWFERFGTVTQVAIDPHSPKALVSFSTHEEAHAAWKSEDAVFNNRFVKIFWHRPLEGHGLAGARALAASAPLVANMAARSTPAHAPPPATTTTQLAATRKTNANTTASDLAAKQALLEQQIAEQKSLMASLDTASAEEKKEILSRLRKLNEEMKKPVSSTQNTSLNGASQANTGKEKERLDKELELHSAKGAVTEGGEEESTEALKAKLEQLKAEVRSITHVCLPLSTVMFVGRESWHYGLS
ncbi:hypothetical protein AX16_005646 [Volvariella volvacea WC 439]|nr:hypothetical protein AX16_005646 [Volvariella volvacea WC 439]